MWKTAVSFSIFPPHDISTTGIHGSFFFCKHLDKTLHIIYTFFPSIAAAFVLAYLMNPIYRYFLKISKRKSFSALSVLFLSFILIIFPTVLIAVPAQRQVMALLSPQTITVMQNAIIDLQVFFFERFGIDLFQRVDSAGVYTQIAVVMQNAITAFAPRVVISLTGFLLSAFLIFFLLYYRESP